MASDARSPATNRPSSPSKTGRWRTGRSPPASSARSGSQDSDRHSVLVDAHGVPTRITTRWDQPTPWTIVLQQPAPLARASGSHRSGSARKLDRRQVGSPASGRNAASGLRCSMRRLPAVDPERERQPGRQPGVSGRKARIDGTDCLPDQRPRCTDDIGSSPLARPLSVQRDTIVVPGGHRPATRWNDDTDAGASDVLRPHGLDPRSRSTAGRNHPERSPTRPPRSELRRFARPLSHGRWPRGHGSHVAHTPRVHSGPGRLASRHPRGDR